MVYSDTTDKTAEIEIRKLDLPSRSCWKVKIGNIIVEKTY